MTRYVEAFKALADETRLRLAGVVLEIGRASCRERV